MSMTSDGNSNNNSGNSGNSNNYSGIDPRQYLISRPLSPMPEPLKRVPFWDKERVTESLFHKHARQLLVNYAVWLTLAAAHITDDQRARVRRNIVFMQQCAAVTDWTQRSNMLVANGGIAELGSCVWPLDYRDGDDVQQQQRRYDQSTMCRISVEYSALQILLIVGCATCVINNDEHLNVCTVNVLSTQVRNRCSARYHKSLSPRSPPPPTPPSSG